LWAGIVLIHGFLQRDLSTFCIHGYNIQQLILNQTELGILGFSRILPKFQSNNFTSKGKNHLSSPARNNSVYQEEESDGPLYFSLTYFDWKGHTLPKQASLVLKHTWNCIMSVFSLQIKYGRKNKNIAFHYMHLIIPG